MRIQILLFDGFDEVDALGAYEVLHNAAAAGATLRVELARLDRGTVTSAYGLQLHVPASFEADAPPALLLVPGAGWLSEAEPGSWAERERARIAAAVAAAHGRGATVAGVGSGATVLAAGGLLRGRHATTHSHLREDLRALGAELVSERVVDDGDVVTSAGMTSGVDLALWLAERFASRQVAEQVAHRLGAERRGGVWRREGGG